jgi:hypothetical protein
MSRLTVTDVTVPVLLELIRHQEWVVPQFQRDFVWTVADVIKLVDSILDSRPIGMATLWEQDSATQSEVDTEPIWIPDGDKHQFLGGEKNTPIKHFAILDGRQRCTAIAMAFGGLRSYDHRSKFAGRFYLDVSAVDVNERVVFKKDAEIKRLHIESDAACIGRGLFPLSSSLENEQQLSQWMRYLQALKNKDNYPGAVLPSDEELERRDRILKNAFEGIVNTRLAVYGVPGTYHLATICEIFETLNQTGTIVSTVDLIHSWLYAETRKDPEGPIILRDWIQDLGQKDGAIGWSSLDDRPELIAQFVTACYVALTSKPNPRSISGGGAGSITSVKAADLLATPTKHWRSVNENSDLFARFIGDFQQVVAGGAFPYKYSPYPVAGAIYVALRWHKHFDQPAAWGREDLDSLFKAFFWRNALTSRYDQGFLSQLGADIKELSAILDKRGAINSPNEWAIFAQKSLDSLIAGIMPTRSQLVDLLTDGRQTGALQKALTLTLLAGSHKDLLDPQFNISFPGGEPPELHHIFPRAWCASNCTGELAKILNKEQAGRNWVESTANLMPLSRKSNNIWKAKVPSQILAEKQAQFSIVKSAAKEVFIDEIAFEHLLEGSGKIREFWERRAEAIASDILGRTTVTL